MGMWSVPSVLEVPASGKCVMQSIYSTAIGLFFPPFLFSAAHLPIGAAAGIWAGCQVDEWISAVSSRCKFAGGGLGAKSSPVQDRVYPLLRYSTPLRQFIILLGCLS